MHTQSNAETELVDVASIIIRPAMIHGHADVLAGRQFDADAYADNARAQWSYERGRLFAYCYAGPLQTSTGKPSKRAVTAYSEAFATGSML